MQLLPLKLIKIHYKNNFLILNLLNFHLYNFIVYISQFLCFTHNIRINQEAIHQYLDYQDYQLNDLGKKVARKEF